MSTFSTRDEDWHGGGRLGRGGARGGHGEGGAWGRDRCDGGDRGWLNWRAGVAGGDGGRNIRVASRCCVAAFAFNAFDDGDRGLGWGRRKGFVLASVAFLAVGTDTSVDGADGARVAVAVLAGGNGGGPGGHRVDGGGGSDGDADVVGTASLTIAAVIIGHASVGAEIGADVVGADLSIATIRLGHATEFDRGDRGRWGRHTSKSWDSESESNDGVEDHFDCFD